ncbi:hypothetical protein DFH06DRAFT_1169563 [Mycena polygramma]|nr:hypothetical protein DFH06DRAFT_1169563 [Mycena polygramma]
MIPLGDLDLQREIRLDKGTGVVHLRRPTHRRVYSAKLQGQGQTITVAMYRGDGAAEEWRQEIETYMSLRHPNIMQMYGAASWSGMHATVFHGDLIPFDDFWDTYKDFPCLTAYIYSHCIQQYQEAADYLRPMLNVDTWLWNYTMWIRRPTGRLCVDLMPSPPNVVDLDFTLEISVSEPEATGLFAGNAPDIEALVIDTLTLEVYHEVCHQSLRKISLIDIPARVTVHLGTVISRSANNDFVEIASLPDASLEISDWANSGEGEGEIMENGWTRCSNSLSLQIT